MKRFKVLVCGENFLVWSEGAVKRMGFYTTRFVEAADEEEAESVALETLRQEPVMGDATLNDAFDPPLLFAERVDEIPPAKRVRKRWSGLTFFEEPRVLH